MLSEFGSYIADLVDISSLLVSEACIGLIGDVDYISIRMSVLADVATQLEALPLGGLLVGHCLLIALMFRFLRDKFLLSYWVSVTPSKCVFKERSVLSDSLRP